MYRSYKIHNFSIFITFAGLISLYSIFVNQFILIILICLVFYACYFQTNTVNFKMIQNVLYILARQLRILQRHVSLEHTRRLHMVENEIRVTEIKVHSKRPKDTSPDTSTSKRGDGSPEKRS